MTKKTALILSGGGSRGAFQCAAEKYAREIKGYHWDIIAGVSVGALNGSMIAMDKGQRLFEIWDSISNKEIYTGGFNLISILKILFGARSFYGNEPLQKLIDSELNVELMNCDLRIGAVSLTTGEYYQFSSHDPHLKKAVLASTAIPVVWAPVNISDQYQEMVDGGIRNISPIGDVLDSDPDEIIIINCSEPKLTQPEKPLVNILDIGLRALELLINEIFSNDVNEFIRINSLVKEAKEHNIVLHHPKSGRPLRYFDYKLIQPDEQLGDTLDFSKSSIQKSIASGFRKAREVLGR